MATRRRAASCPPARPSRDDFAVERRRPRSDGQEVTEAELRAAVSTQRLHLVFPKATDLIINNIRGQQDTYYVALRVTLRDVPHLNWHSHITLDYSIKMTLGELYRFKTQARSLLQSLHPVGVIFKFSARSNSWALDVSEGMALVDLLRRCMPWSLRSWWARRQYEPHLTFLGCN